MMRRLGFLIFCFVFLWSCKDDVQVSNPEIISSSQLIMVEIKGAVKYPGVYEVEQGTIIKDVVSLAGGVLDSANLASISMVTKIENNQLIVIPTINEVSTKININSASSGELTSIKGIGVSKAEAIIKYRNEVGLFTSIEDIKKVSGISESLFEKIKTFITV